MLSFSRVNTWRKTMKLYLALCIAYSQLLLFRVLLVNKLQHRRTELPRLKWNQLRSTPSKMTSHKKFSSHLLEAARAKGRKSVTMSSSTWELIYSSKQFHKMTHIIPFLIKFLTNTSFFFVVFDSMPEAHGTST